jgi:cytochrome c-type biogenesis protein CcmH
LISRFVKLLLLLYLVSFALGVGSAHAQRSPYDEDVLREARAVYSQIMSPYCPGQNLANCGSGAAEVLRQEIRERLAAGETQEAIIASLIERFGESVLAAPPNKGLGRLAWIGPFAILLVGAILVVVYLKRHTARETEPHETSEIDPEVRARVEAELKSHRAT